MLTVKGFVCEVLNNTEKKHNIIVLMIHIVVIGLMSTTEGKIARSKFEKRMTMTIMLLKGCPRFCYAGRGSTIFSGQKNALSKDWNVVGGSKLYVHTIWTPPAVLDDVWLLVW